MESAPYFNHSSRSDSRGEGLGGLGLGGGGLAAIQGACRCSVAEAGMKQVWQERATCISKTNKTAPFELKSQRRRVTHGEEGWVGKGLGEVGSLQETEYTLQEHWIIQLNGNTSGKFIGSTLLLKTT